MTTRGHHSLRRLRDQIEWRATVSEHLACLRDCGLVGSRPVGRSSVHFLAQPTLFDLLEAAETLLAATGDAVTLCPNYQAHR